MRLMGAALIGAAIGYERELRAKGAGLRTHVLVAVGSCLFMLISQYGFNVAEMSVMFPKKHSGMELMRKITSAPGIELISME